MEASNNHKLTAEAFEGQINWYINDAKEAKADAEAEVVKEEAVKEYVANFHETTE